MRSAIEQVGETVVEDVLNETVDELTGRSTRKWAVVLVAFVVGCAVAALVMRRRQRSAAGTVQGDDNTTADTSEQGSG
jgi:hypothetical protein